MDGHRCNISLLRACWITDTKKEALRIAKKFVSLIEKCYSTTHNLWEKYNVVTGDMQVSAEYKTPTMLGWTYGIYECFCEIIKEINQSILIDYWYGLLMYDHLLYKLRRPAMKSQDKN